MVTGFESYDPVTIILLLESTVMLFPSSSLDPVILVAHVPTPFESYLTINVSSEPLLGNVPNVVPSAL